MSTSQSSRRQSAHPSSASSAPKPPVHFSSSITISEKAALSGIYPITVSSESVVHPLARLDSSAGPVNVGRRCVVHERAHLGGGDREGSVTLGDYVTVETAAHVEGGGTMVCEGTTVGVACRVGRGAFVGKNCTLTPQSVVAPGEKIPDGTVVYSNGLRRPDRRGATDLKHYAQARQIEVLRRLIPTVPAKFQ